MGSAVAKFNREQSLHAMWQAFRARSFTDQQLVENDAGLSATSRFKQAARELGCEDSEERFVGR
jgi:hypothetical protein